MGDRANVPSPIGPASGNEPLSADLSFPQLKVATNPELMQEVFQKHLRPLDGKVYQVRECRISHIRHKPNAGSYTLAYNLRLAEPTMQHERTQWVTGVMYPGLRTRWVWEKLRLRRIWERLLRSDLMLGIPAASSTFKPLSYISTLKMLIQVFPYDRGLPALPLLTSGPPSKLKPLLLARFGSGNWQIEAYNTKLVHYMPEQRATLRMTLLARETASGRVEERHFYAKVYHKKRGKKTYQVLQMLWDKCGVEGLRFTVPRPIAYQGALRTLVQEEAPGTPLKDILLRDDEGVLPAVRNTALALADLHLSDVVARRDGQPWREIEVARLGSIGQVLQSACPHLEPEIKEVVRYIIAGLKEVSPAPTHRDLTLEEIILDGDRVTLLDFDTFAEADPILDVGRLLANLTSLPLYFTISQERARTISRAFVEEYFAYAPEAWRSRLPFHYAGALLRMANRIFWDQRPGWPDKIEALLKEARNTSAGKVW